MDTWEYRSKFIMVFKAEDLDSILNDAKERGEELVTLAKTDNINHYLTVFKCPVPRRISP